MRRHSAWLWVVAFAVIATVGWGAYQDPPQKIPPHPDVQEMLEDYWLVDEDQEEQHLLKTIEKAKSLGDVAGEGMACFYMAEYAFDYDDSERRMTFYKRAIPLLESTNNFADAARAYNSIAYIHMGAETDEDEQWLENAITAAKTALKSGDYEVIATTHSDLAWAYDFLEKWKEAVAAYRVALQYAGRLEDKTSYKDIAISFIDAQVDRDLMNEAVDTAQRAIGVLETSEAGNAHVPEIELRIGEIYALKGEYERAHEYLSGVLDSIEDDPFTSASICLQLAAVQLLLDRPLDAAETYRKGAAFARQAAGDKDSADEFTLVIGTAKALAIGGKAGESREALEKCAAMAEATFEESQLVYAWVAIASVAVYTGEKEWVRKSCDEIRESSDAVEDPDRIALKHFVTGRILYFIGDYEDAETDLSNGLKEIEKLETMPADERPVWRAQALYLLGEVYASTSRPKKASECFNEAEAIDAENPGTLDSIDEFDSALRGETDQEKKKRESKTRNQVSLNPPSGSAAADFGGATIGGDIRSGAKDYALLIACEDYEKFDDLTYPLKDAEDLAQILRDHYGYEVTILENPKTKDEVRDAILAYNSKSVTPGDQLLVFFAGHGDYDETAQDGYLAFGESDKEKEDSLLYFQRLEGYLNGLKIRHIALILDSCFGGTFLEALKSGGVRGGPPREIDRATINRDLVQISRKVLASGADEVVPDKSEFARRIIEELMNSSRDVLSIFDVVAAVQGLPRQTPVFSGFKADRPNGTFLFIRKR